MKTSVPAAVNATVPPVTATGAPPAVMALPLICVTVRASPSASLSLARTSIATGVSSVPANVSFAATGASLTDATVPLTVAVEARPPGSATV